jgi:hypothetical protein
VVDQQPEKVNQIPQDSIKVSDFKKDGLPVKIELCI